MQRWRTLVVAGLFLAAAAGCDGDGGGASADPRADGLAADTTGIAPDAGGDGDADAPRDGGRLDTALDDSAGDGDTADGDDPAADGGTPPRPLDLAPGEAVEVALSDGAATVALATPTGDEAFVLVLASTVLDGVPGTFAYQLTLDDAAEAAATVDRLPGCTLTSAPWRDAAPPTEDAPQGEPPEVGDTRTFWMQAGFGSVEVPAEVIAVGETAVVWADVTAERPALLEADFVTEFSSDFEDLILPRARTIFGIESDIDGDGRVALLFSPRTYDSAVAFFTGCDLLPMTGCPTGNAAEVLYVTPPNVIDPPYDTPNAMKEILAHELQHLVHFGRQVLGNDLNTWPENAYVLEGLAALAQDVLGFQSGNLYVTKAGLDDLADFSLGEVLAPWGQYHRDRDGALRGGAYLFARWLYDRAGGDRATDDGAVQNRGGPAFVHALLEDARPASAVLPEVADASIEDVAMDFFTTLALSNREGIGDAPAENPCFRYLPIALDPVTGRQRGADLFVAFHGQRMNGPATTTAGAADGTLRAGGVDLLSLTAAAGEGTRTFTVSVDPEAAPRLRIARVR